MRIFILGGKGFIGSSILSELSKLNDVKIFCSTRQSDFIDSSGAIWINIDVFRDRNSLKEMIDNADVIINCIGEVVDKGLMEEINFGLVKNIVDILSARNSSNTRLIQISSVGCYGAITRFKNTRYIVDEDEVERPVGMYEETKTKADDYIRSHLSDVNLSSSYTILRPTNVFGTEMKSNAIRTLALMVKKGRFFYISDKSAISTYVHAKDVAQSVRLVIENLSLTRNEIYIISDDCEQNKLIDNMALSLGVNSPRIVVPFFIVRTAIKTAGKLFQNFPLSESKVNSLTSKVSFSNVKIKQLGFMPRSSIYNKEVMNSILNAWGLK